jgi:hypothetical protein
MSDAPERIWTWPRHTPTGLVAWGSGDFRAEPRRPLDDKTGPTGIEYIRADIARAEVEAAVKAERAECAELSDTMYSIDDSDGLDEFGDGLMIAGRRIAAAIRARGGDDD